MRNERIKTKRTKRAGWGADGGYNEGPTYTSKKLLSFSDRLRVRAAQVSWSGWAQRK
jgi:hypothetical protein